MKKLLVGALVAASFFSFEARAQERAGCAALGAVSAPSCGTSRCCSRRTHRIRRGTVDRALLGNAAKLVEMTVPSDEMGDIEMTPAILDQITAIQDAACDALG